MFIVEYRDADGDLLATLETVEGAVARRGDMVRVGDEDFEVDYVRWNITEAGVVVQLLLRPVNTARWPEGAPTGGKVIKIKGKG